MVVSTKRFLSKGLHNEILRLLDNSHCEVNKHSGDAAGFAAIARKYRDRLLSRQGSTAIGAYAIKIAIESRGEYPHDADWESFRELAAQAERPSRDRKLEEERRRMRALAVLWALWSSETVTYYKWELHSLKVLTQLAKVAMQFPRWPVFLRNLNYVMLSRHEQTLNGGGNQPIGRHHSSCRVQDESSPLEACDVDC